MQFGLPMFWGANSHAPSIGKNVCLSHTYEGSGEEEHERPRVFENELTREEIEAETAGIKRMHESGNKTSEIHKYLQAAGKRLGEKGKQIVRAMRTKFDKEKTSSSGGFNDAQRLLDQLEEDAAFKRFKLDEENHLTCLAWAHEEQRRNAEKYHSVIVTDTTFNTNKYNHKLAFIVVVDKENHTQIAMQALLNTERHESFVFLMVSFKLLIHGRSPQVIFTNTDQSEMSAI
eukprot:g12120.t2